MQRGFSIGVTDILAVALIALTIHAAKWFHSGEACGMTSEKSNNPAKLVSARGEKAAPVGETKAAADPAAGPEGQAVATFGAGCFWGVESAFQQVPGVTSTAVGFSGGSMKNPSYHDVCGKTTGHAEVVQVMYDPNKVRYEDLLAVFWKCHDPTQLNRQGPDFGSQYRSVIFYHTPEQKAAADAAKAKLNESARPGRPIVTEIAPAGAFYRAEEYHQHYLEKRGQLACPSTVHRE
jgi:peptide-methionine (S)-S-oxide reductase